MLVLKYDGWALIQVAVWFCRSVCSWQCARFHKFSLDSILFEAPHFQYLISLNLHSLALNFLIQLSSAFIPQLKWHLEVANLYTGFITAPNFLSLNHAHKEEPDSIINKEQNRKLDDTWGEMSYPLTFQNLLQEVSQLTRSRTQMDG
jgi:hypothetical protein